MADPEIRTSVDIIANVRAASAIAIANDKRAKGQTKGPTKKEKKDAKVRVKASSKLFVYFFFLYPLPSFNKP